MTVTDHFRFRGNTLQLAESNRQFVHGNPVTATSHLTLRILQTVQAWLARSRARNSGGLDEVSPSELEEPIAPLGFCSAMCG